MTEAASGALPQEAIRVAERLVQRRFGGRSRVVGVEGLESSDRWSVARLRTEGEPAPAAVIVKMARDVPGGAGLVGPPGELARCTNELVGATFLESLGLDPPPVAMLVGADSARRLLLFEDLGGGDSLATRLTGTDETAAIEALHACARGLGRIQAGSAGRIADYDRLLQRVQRGRRTLDEFRSRVRAEVQALAGTFEELKFEWTPALVDEVQTVAASMLDPGPFLTYVHGDATPGHERLLASGDSGGQAARFFGLEFGGFRHALLDGVSSLVPFPTGACCSVIPSDIVRGALRVYQTELSKGIREAEDDELFGRAVVEASAFWMIVSANRMLPRSLRFDQTWGLATYRQRVMRQLQSLSEASLHHRHLPALGHFASTMYDRLKRKWPEHKDMAGFMAFAANEP